MFSTSFWGIFDLFPFIFPASVLLLVSQSICPFLWSLTQLPCGFLRPVVDAGILGDLGTPKDLLGPRVAEVGGKELLFWHDAGIKVELMSLWAQQGWIGSLVTDVLWVNLVRSFLKLIKKCPFIAQSFDYPSTTTSVENQKTVFL